MAEKILDCASSVESCKNKKKIESGLKLMDLEFKMNNLKDYFKNISEKLY